MSVEDLTRNAVDVLPKGGLEEKLRWFYCDGPHGPGRAFLLNTGG